MRIHLPDEDRTVTNADIYLTDAEAAEMLGRLHSLVTDLRTKTFSITDKQFDHQLRLHRYSEHEQSGFDSRQKQIILADK